MCVVFISLYRKVNINHIKYRIMLQKVKSKDRLPKKEGRYFVEYTHNNFETTAYFNGNRFETSEFEEIAYWYEDVKEAENIHYRAGFIEANRMAKVRRERLLDINRKFHKSIACDFEDKGILYKSDLLKMPLPAETVNDLSDWFLEMSEILY